METRAIEEISPTTECIIITDNSGINAYITWFDLLIWACISSIVGGIMHRIFC